MESLFQIAHGFAVEITERLLAVLERRHISEASLAEQLTNSIENHLTRVLNWSQTVQFYGMTSGAGIREKTISLSMEVVPRKFRGDKRGKRVDEFSILNYPGHRVLLGDPGAGKTTTMKRLARHVLLDKKDSTEVARRYPIVILLREIQPSPGSEGDIHSASAKETHGLSIFELIADAIGIRYIFKEVEQLDGRLSRKISIPFASGNRLDALIVDILDSTGAILFLDGLDEIPTSYRSTLERSIEILQYQLRRCKVILTCRSGDFTRHMDGFEVVEICPLEREQMNDIATKWLEDGHEFLKKISALPFFDLAGRPLFLCQLMVLYQNSGYIPDEPSSVYRRIINLLLEDWDRTRGVQRRSRYANFFPEKKLDFLSALSYHLTFKLKVKRFGRRDLVETYLAIHEFFSLPKGEALEVAKEIETHTGIIVESGYEFFEFSHLSLQEYLCGYYLVREPFAEHLVDYMREFPSPIAIAIALSANPSNWFSTLILTARIFSEANADGLASLLSRLEQERPNFVRSQQLGFAIIDIVFHHWEKLREHLERLVARDAVRKSLLDALDWYHVDFTRSNTTRLWLQKKPGYPIRTRLYYPEEGSLPISLFNIVSQGTEVTIQKVSVGSGMRGSFVTEAPGEGK